MKYVVSPSWKIQVLFKHLKCNCGSSCTYCSKSSEQFVLSYHSSLGKYPFKLQRRGNTIVHCIFPRCVSAILIAFEHLKCNYGSSVTIACDFSIQLVHKILNSLLSLVITDQRPIQSSAQTQWSIAYFPKCRDPFHFPNPDCGLKKV